MDQRRVQVVGFQARHRQDAAVVHDDGVALRVAGAGGVAHDLGVELLIGGVPGHGPGDHVRRGAGAVELYHIGADGPLLPVGHEPLPDQELGACLQFRGGGADGVVHALDLHHLHLHGAAFVLIYLGARVQDALALPFPGAVVLLHVLHVGVLAHVEPVDAVVLRVLVAAVIDAAARHDQHVRPLAHEEVVVDHLLEARLCQDHGDMDALVLGEGCDADVHAAHVRLRGDLDVGRGPAARHLAVGPDVVGPLGHGVQVRDLPQKPLLYLVQLHACAPPFPEIMWHSDTAEAVPMSWGRILSRGPCFSTRPSLSTTISSAMLRIRS